MLIGPPRSIDGCSGYYKPTKLIPVGYRHVYFMCVFLQWILESKLNIICPISIIRLTYVYIINTNRGLTMASLVFVLIGRICITGGS